MQCVTDWGRVLHWLVICFSLPGNAMNYAILVLSLTSQRNLFNLLAVPFNPDLGASVADLKEDRLAVHEDLVLVSRLWKEQ